jgi:hypothetical protein
VGWVLKGKRGEKMKRKFPFRDHGFEKLACSVTENVR